MNQAITIMQEVGKVFIGKDDIIRKAMMCVLAKGHILLEDIPGVGKTMLALAFSKAMALDYRRVQFTPDVLPSDITGFTIYDQKTGNMEYRPGAALCNLLLADEINRANSRTQAALLEAMEEGQITVDGTTHPLPKPFIVIATQNPIGAHGTQMLPDSQMDRFMLRLSIGYPKPDDELKILMNNLGIQSLETIRKSADARSLLQMQKEVVGIFIHEQIYDYIIRLVSATRTHPMIQQGASIRASLAVMNLAQASAFLDERDYVIPSDILGVFNHAVEHRLMISAKAKMQNVSAAAILKNIIDTIEKPRIGQ